MCVLSPKYLLRRMPLFISSSLLLSLTVTSCSTTALNPINPQINTPLTQKSPQTNSVTFSPHQESWVTLSPGEEVYGLEFTKERSLVYQGKVLLSNIPVSYQSQGEENLVVSYAARIIVSTPSPSGQFHFLKGCDSPAEEFGLCWAVYLVDKEKGEAKKTAAGKYGPEEWVQWSKDERYAILANGNEGSWWFHAIDLQTGYSKSFAEIGCFRTIDFKSFAWVNDRVFTVKVISNPDISDPNIPSCQQETDPSFWFRGNIEDIF